ncbi:MAG TPA: SRPBCC domain-containing protein [Ktedonobacterales bacterium]
MADVSATRASTQATQWVNAPREVVYRAFLDQDAVAAWQHPDGMRLQIHEFEPGEGGRFRVSLTYENAADSPGKTSDTTDTYHGWFARLIPYTTITQVVEFESAKEEFAGEMRITVTLAEVDGGTEVTYRCDNIPPGIRPEDNEVGCRMSLRKLATLLETGRPESGK